MSYFVPFASIENADTSTNQSKRITDATTATLITLLKSQLTALKTNQSGYHYLQETMCGNKIGIILKWQLLVTHHGNSQRTRRKKLLSAI